LGCVPNIDFSQFLLVSPFETNNPSAHASLFLVLKLLAVISLVVELWLGFHFLNWLSGIFILVGTTIGADLALTGLSRKWPLYLVIMIMVIVGMMLSAAAISSLH
jgi:hypothetical protein